MEISCTCGSLRGTLSETKTYVGGRFSCMCDDCQTYAHYLGRANEILDKNGGTDILPVYPSTLKITSGFENLKCMRLSPNGLYRWYAGCCSSPIGNTPTSAAMPYIGLVTDRIKTSNKNETFKPMRAHLMAKFGKAPFPPNTSFDRPPVSVMLYVIRFMLKGKLFGKSKPHPFFDSANAPIVKPEVIEKSERERLRNTALAANERKS